MDEHATIGPAQFLGIVGSALERFREVAQEELGYHDFGVPVGSLLRTIDRVVRDVRRVADDGPAGSYLHRFLVENPRIASRVVQRPASLLRYAASLMLTEIARDWMAAEDRERAWASKLAYLYLVDALDDLVDRGAVRVEHVEELFRLALAAPCLEEGDIASYRATFAICVETASVEAERAVLDTPFLLRELLHDAPGFPRLVRLLRSENHLFALGQSLEAELRHPDHRGQELIARLRSLPMPVPGLDWPDRLVKCLTWVTSMTFIDLMFAPELPASFDLERHRAAWCALDVVLGEMDHLLMLSSDRDAGVTNVAELWFKGTSELDGSESPSRAPLPTSKQYEELFAHWADLTLWTLDQDPPHAGRSDVYRDLALAIPVAMLYLQAPRSPDLLHGYLRTLASRLRARASPSRNRPDRTTAVVTLDHQRATYSQQGSPVLTHRVLTTRPSTRRLRSIPS